MKVLHVSPNHFPFVGGVESLVRDICFWGIPGIEFVICFPDVLGYFPEPYFVDKSLVVPFALDEDIRNNFRPGTRHSNAQIFEILKSCRSFLQDLKPDLLHIHALTVLALPMALIASASKIPFVTHVHGVFPFAERPRNIERLLSLSKTVIHVSPESLKATSDLDQQDKSIFLLPNAVNVSTISYRAPSESKKYDFMIAGRLEEEKGFEIAIKAFASIKNLFENCRLLIAGNGPLRGALEDLIRELDIDSSVEFLGTLSRLDLHNTMSKSFCVIVPSLRVEGFGLVAAEASALGRPVIASDVGGLPTTVLDKVTGILFPRGNVEALEKSMLHLIENPRLADSLGNQGRIRAEKLFGFDRYMTELTKIYSQIT